MNKRLKRGFNTEQTSASGGRLITPGRIRMATTVAVLFLALGLAFQVISRRDALPPEGTARVTECDRLAAHPSDTQRLTPGIKQPDVDIPAAKAACSAALAANPGDGRILYQLGRAYFYDGDLEQGIAYFRQSDAVGYAQGQFVLGLIYAQGNGVEPDACIAGSLWVKAARQRHLYSKVFLVNNWLDGMFDPCELGVTAQELDGLVSMAAELADTPQAQDDVAAMRAA
jgi:TPR repeat protein